MSKNAKPHRDPTHEEIAAAAQRLYELEGRPEGKAMQHWLQAEAQLKTDKAQTATRSTGGQAPATQPSGDHSPRWQPSNRQPVQHN